VLSKRLVMAVLGLLVLSAATSGNGVNAQAGYNPGAKVFGMTGYNAFYGIMATKMTPALSLAPNYWVASPVGVSQGDGTYIESGPRVLCGAYGCSYIPYMAFRTEANYKDGYNDFSHPISPGAYYTYQSTKSYPGIGNFWTSWVYWGGQWLNLAVPWGGGVDLGLPYMFEVGSGGENGCVGCAMGWTYGYFHYYMTLNNMWTPWCWTYPRYDPPDLPSRTGAAVYGCGNNYDWYAGQPF